MAIIQNLEAFVQSYPAGLDSVTDLQLSQNENGRQIRFTIGGVTIPAGSVATISGTKPDGVVYSNTGTIEGADTVIFDEDVQMTAVFGTWYAKIRITNAGNTIASARVRFIIDKDPVDSGAIPSESQLDGLVAEAEEYAEAAEDAAERAAITYGSPLTASTASAMTDINRVYVYTGSESGYTYGNWYYYNGSAWVSGGVYNSAAVETDTTLTESGVPADAKATGDKIDELRDDLEQIVPGLSNEAKEALLACFRNVAWIGDDGQDYYDALEAALDEEHVELYVWDGTNSSSAEGWVNANKIKGISDPSALVIIGGRSIHSGAAYVSENNYTYDDSGPIPYEITGRATSRDQIIVGDLDGKTVSMTRFTLTSGATVTFALWYGYLNVDDNTFNSLQAMSNTKYYNINYWYSSAAVLPTNSSRTGKRLLCMVFKKGNGTTDFTQAELDEIPSLITILDYANTTQYLASSGVLLSNAEGLEVVDTIGDMQQSISNNILNVKLPAGTGRTHYVMIRKSNYNPSTVTKAVIKCKYRLHNIAQVLAESGIGLSIKSGSSCAGIYTHRSSDNQYRFAVYNSSNTAVDTSKQLNLEQWYEVEAYIENGTQTIKVDGETIYEGAGNTHYGSSGIVFTRTLSEPTSYLDADIEWLKIQYS